jgi:preprotein translocase subunit YajC
MISKKTIGIAAIVIVVLAAGIFYFVSSPNAGQTQVPQPAGQATQSGQSVATTGTPPSLVVAAATGSATTSASPTAKFNASDNLDQTIQDLNVIQP